MIKKLIAYLLSFAHKQEIKLGTRVDKLVDDAEAEFDFLYQQLHATLENAYTRAHELAHAAVIREQDAVAAAKRILLAAEHRLEDAIQRRTNIQSTMGEVQDFGQENSTLEEDNATYVGSETVADIIGSGSKAAAE